MGTVTLHETDASTQITYWYTGDSFDLNEDDIWIPYFSLTDAPYSLPLRGFISDSRNYFFDFGAFNWYSDWAESVWGWQVPAFEKRLDELHLQDQLLYLFENATSHLSRPINYVDIERGYSVLDYVKDFDAPFEAYVPIVVMYGLNDTYDDTNMRDWVIHPDFIEQTFNESFPLIDFTVELYWFDYNNATEFGDLMTEKTQNDLVMIDDDFLNQSDFILHDIIASNPLYSSSDLVLPTLVMLQQHTLWSTYYNMAIGGLGRIGSEFPEIDTWCLNGRSVYSYFYGGDPNEPRTAITPTVIHELGHCMGQTDIHSEFGCLAASSCMSAMAAYQQPTSFDRYDLDLINIGQTLQFWGRYLDEIDFFRGFTLSTTRENQLNTLQSSLSEIPALLRVDDYSEIRELFYSAEDLLDLISSELMEPRKSSDWSDTSPALNVHIDWILGPGIPNADVIGNSLETLIDTTRDLVTCQGTELPSPLYNVTIGVHSTNAVFENSLSSYWDQQLTTANTSSYSHESVPPDAWDTYPRNTIFQTQSGYAIDGYNVEDWLTEHPFTIEVNNAIHYRFYIMNLEDILSPQQSGLTQLLPYILVGSVIVFVVVVAIIWSKKSR